jgi:hypothetical protein
LLALGDDSWSPGMPSASETCAGIAPSPSSTLRVGGRSARGRLIPLPAPKFDDLRSRFLLQVLTRFLCPDDYPVRGRNSHRLLPMKEKTLARAGLFCAMLASGTLPRKGARLLAQMPAAVSPSDSASTASAAVEEKHDDGNIFRRLGRAYAEDWNGTAPATPEAPRRGFPAPLASPPFPFSDWPYGGSPVIGVIDTAGGPLMRAIYAGKEGGWWERNRIKIYGWINLAK